MPSWILYRRVRGDTKRQNCESSSKLQYDGLIACRKPYVTHGKPLHQDESEMSPDGHGMTLDLFVSKNEVMWSLPKTVGH